MGDRLTQLQDSIDEFLIQCYAGLNYTEHHHTYADIPTQPSQAPPTVSASDPAPDTTTAPTAPTTPATTLTNGNAAQRTQQNLASKDQPSEDEPPKAPEPSDKPHSAAEQTASLRELAQGLVLKEQQIEYLVQSLPGIGSSERDQERRIRELQEELRVVERERGRRRC